MFKTDLTPERVAELNALKRAISHAVNCESIDACCNMADHVLADKLAPRVLAHLAGETGVQAYERMSSQQRLLIGSDTEVVPPPAEAWTIAPADAVEEMARVREALDGFKWAEGLYFGEQLTVEKIGTELADLRMVSSEVSLVYDHVTGGAISRPNTLAGEVIAQHDDKVSEEIREAVAEALADCDCDAAQEQQP